MTTPHDDHSAGRVAEPVEEPVTGQPGPGADTAADTGVDAAVARLDDLPDRPVSEHVEVYDDIHARLRDALEEAAVDPAPQPHG